MVRKQIKFNNKTLSITIYDEADESVMREVFKFREYRSAEESIVKLVKEPILDIGAHAGFFTMYARILNPDIPIYSVEPEKFNLNKLKEHLEINNIRGITIIDGVLGAVSGSTKIRLSSDSHNHEVVDEEVEGEKYQTVKSYSFLDLLKKTKVKKVGLLKMDIEGGEYKVLESWGIEEFALVKNIILEYHNNREYNFKEIENKLRENGFSVQIFPSQFDKSMGFIFAHNKRSK